MLGGLHMSEYCTWRSNLRIQNDAISQKASVQMIGRWWGVLWKAGTLLAFPQTTEKSKLHEIKRQCGLEKCGSMSLPWKISVLVSGVFQVAFFEQWFVNLWVLIRVRSHWKELYVHHHNHDGHCESAQRWHVGDPRRAAFLEKVIWQCLVNCFVVLILK